MLAEVITREPRLGVEGVLHVGQLEAMKSEKRFVFVIAGSGGGKSSLGPRWLYREIKRHEQEPADSQRYLVFAPSFKILNRATLPPYLKFLRELGVGEWAKADMVFRLRNGAEIYFGSCDNPESLEGMHLRAAHGDEIGQDSVTYTVWETIQRRLGYHRGRFLGTTTPYNYGWLKRRIVDRFEKGELPDVDVVTFASIVNPGYDLEELRRAYLELPRFRFRMFYLGEFNRPANLVYDVFNEDEHVVDPFDIPASWRRYAGLDFGIRHPTAAVFGALDPRPHPDVLYLYATYRQASRSTMEHAEQLRLRGPVLKIFADPASPQLQMDYKAHGLPVENGDRQVLGGIQEVYSRLATGRLKLFRGAAMAPWIDEVYGYRWKRRISTDEALQDVPIEEDDDLMDATRYLVAGLRKPKAADLRAQSEDHEPGITAGIWSKRW